jgi:hypothetical protein
MAGLRKAMRIGQVVNGSFLPLRHMVASLDDETG